LTRPGGEALATTALTGLVNSFVVSLLGRIAKTNIGEPVRQGLPVNSPPLRHAARPGS
jgi:hypothetical protein